MCIPFEDTLAERQPAVQSQLSELPSVARKVIGSPAVAVSTTYRFGWAGWAVWPSPFAFEASTELATKYTSEPSSLTPLSPFTCAVAARGQIGLGRARADRLYS